MIGNKFFHATLNSFSNHPRVSVGDALFVLLSRLVWGLLDSCASLPTLSEEELGVPGNEDPFSELER